MKESEPEESGFRIKAVCRVFILDSVLLVLHSVE
jgi:hypothetical protein